MSITRPPVMNDREHANLRSLLSASGRRRGWVRPAGWLLLHDFDGRAPSVALDNPRSVVTSWDQIAELAAVPSGHEDTPPD